MAKRRQGRRYRACPWDLVSQGPCASAVIRWNGREKTTARTLPACRRSPSSPPAARLPTRVVGWGPALDSGSTVRWVVGRLTPSPLAAPFQPSSCTCR
ncbi:hypothetical protein BDA96_10G184700 [Sorghum bicolor]|uniref:Uncharacterized protein n=1 Tax=Sorghum bicolor TaxID=4558 RepID=A0A921U0Q4_SORBI|nr:hypothetical protein BDA96_10G184700 [Sorghum bicolor]